MASLLSRTRRNRAALVTACALAVAGSVWAWRARAADSGALWRVVHDLCVTDMKISGHAAPCVSVDLAQGFAVLKDLRGRTQLLLIPTARVGGIESPLLLAPGSPNYWRDAWNVRPLFDQQAGRSVPRDDVALAVNSMNGRTQNQLHIHIDCIRAGLKSALQAGIAGLSSRWTPFGGYADGRYKARWVAGEDLGERDPFKLLAEDPDAAADMADETLVMAAASKPDGQAGFVLLSARRNRFGADMAAGEELLDHECAVLNAAA